MTAVRRALSRRATGSAALAALLGTLAMTALTASSAQAYDKYPCTRTSGEYHNGPLSADKWICPLSQGHVPVYSTAHPNARIVGYLKSANGNWFLFQVSRARFSLGSSTNTWWASTKADGNGASGWVPEVYFRGGNNDERDRALLLPPNGTFNDRLFTPPPFSGRTPV